MHVDDHTVYPIRSSESGGQKIPEKIRGKWQISKHSAENRQRSKCKTYKFVKHLENTGEHEFTLIHII